MNDKRDFSDFKNFPGEIVDEIYKFPDLYYDDTFGHKRIWSIQIRLIKKASRMTKPAHDWNLLAEDSVPITEKYLAGEQLPTGTIAQFWIETGIVGGKISRHAPSYPRPANLGKSNERNTFEQCLVKARSKYLKKREDGGLAEREYKSEQPERTHTAHSGQGIAYFPMLANKYIDEKKVDWSQVAYTQPKLDGVRCLVYLSGIRGENVMLSSRRRKPFGGFTHVRRILVEPLRVASRGEFGTLYLDGEFYKHGRSLQDISGEVRNIERNDNPGEDSVQLWLFDCFYPARLEMPFSERIQVLENFFATMGTQEYVKLVPYERASTEQEMMEQYETWIDKKFEGLMYRHPDGQYLAHPSKTGTFLRSHHLLKIKKRYSDEFEVVDFTQGTHGRDKSAIIWICRTNSNDQEPRTFHATPKIINPSTSSALEDRYSLFKEATRPNVFNNKFKGRMMTVEYEDLSRDGVPLRAKAIGFRDYE